MKSFSSVGRVLIAIMMLVQSFLGSFISIPFDGGESELPSSTEVYADHEEGHDVAQDHDLVLTKSIVSETADTIIYRIDVSEVNGIGVTDVIVEDLYGSGLTYSGRVSSTSMFSSTGTLFIDDLFTPKLIWRDMTLPAGNEEHIELEFIKAPDTFQANVAQTRACNQDPTCNDQYVNIKGSASLMTTATPYVPGEYDLSIEKVVANCDGVDPVGFDLSSAAGCTDTDTDGYYLGASVFFTMKYGSDSSSDLVSHAVITDEFDSRLTFSQVVYSSQGLTAPYVTEGLAYDEAGDGYSEAHNYLSFTDGFPLTPGQEEIVVLEFVVDNTIGTGSLLNETAIGIPSDLGNLGTQFYYGAPFGPELAHSVDGETFLLNNEDEASVDLAPRDLRIQKELLTPSYTTAGDIDWDDDVTYRLSFHNNGLSPRDDIAVSDIRKGPYSGKIVGIDPEPGLVIGYGPSMEGHYYEDYIPGVSTLPQSVICDVANNCDETLRWGNIELAANTTGYIDVTVQFPDSYGCSGTLYEDIVENTALVSITDNSSTYPTFLPLFDPSGFPVSQIPVPYPSLFSSTDGINNEFDRTNNVDEVIFDMIGNTTCGGPGGRPPYDLSVKKTVNKIDVCPGEEVDFTMTVYNSGSIDKYVRLQDIYDPTQFDFKEVKRDIGPEGSGSRYTCWFETKSYERMIEALVDIVRIEPLDTASNFVYPMNKTYDKQHYIDTVPGCAAMYDMTSYEYTNYITAASDASNGYADYFWAQYTAYKGAGDSEQSALIQAYADADAYMDANMATITSGYDIVAVGTAVQECYQAQFYDRMFYDQPEVHTPASAQAAADQLASQVTQRCTNLTDPYSKNFKSCLGLFATNAEAFDYYITDDIPRLEGCPLVDMKADSVNSWYINQCGNSYPNCEWWHSNQLNATNFQNQLDWINRVYDMTTKSQRGYNYQTLLDYFGPAGLDLQKPGNYYYASNKYLYAENFLSNTKYTPIQMSKEQFYDYIEDPATDCSHSLLSIDETPGYGAMCGYDYNGSNVSDRLCSTYISKENTCTNPESGLPNIMFAGSTFFDMPTHLDPEGISPEIDGFVVSYPSTRTLHNSYDYQHNNYDRQGLMYVPVNENGIDFTYTLVVAPDQGPGPIFNTGYVDLCDNELASHNSNILRECVTGTAHSKSKEYYTGDIVTEGTDDVIDGTDPNFFVSGDYYVNISEDSGHGASNNRSFAQVNVLDVNTCMMEASLDKGDLTSVNVGDTFDIDIEYCNKDITNSAEGIEIDFTYMVNWNVLNVAGSPGVYTDLASTLSRAGLTVAADTCNTITVTFEALAPNSSSAEMKLDIGQAPTGPCGPVFCAGDTEILETKKATIPTISTQSTKNVTDHADLDISGGYTAGDEISFQLSFTNSYTDGAPGYLEAYDYYHTGYLTYLTSDIAPDYVDSVQGVVYRDRGMGTYSPADTINVTFKINEDVPSSTQITNSVEHLFNVSNTCGCGEDQNPDNSIDDTKILHDLALIKTLDPNNSPYKSGDLVTFDITIENQGEAASSGLVITDYIPAGLTLTDPDWNSNGAVGPATATYDRGTINGIFGTGMNDIVPITFTVNGSALGTTVNRAEISADTPVDENGNEYFGIADVDSTPDAISGNLNDTPGEFPGDDVFGGFDATTGDNSLIGDGIDDEDDHDPERITIETIDVALEKTLVTSGAVAPGDMVTFQVEVFNQSSFELYDIQVIDYLPTGTTFVSSAGMYPFTLSGGEYIAVIDTLAGGGSELIEITLQIDSDFQGTSLTNNAEIIYADDDNDPTTPPLVDADDDLSSQDGSSDDDSEILTDGDTDDEYPGTPGTIDNSTDEDSYDLAQITVVQTFDLAIQKEIDSVATPGPYQVGDNVEFTVEVINQGTLDATDVIVTDYLPTGMSFVSSSDFVLSGSDYVATIDALSGGTSMILSIVLSIDTNFLGDILTNNAEITDATNTEGMIDEDDDLGIQNGSSDDTSEVPTDNDINDDATGTPGSQDNPSDEDSYDPAQVEIVNFDLALEKYIDSTATPGPYMPGDEVTFTIDVFNQGNVDATDIQVSEYLPTGMSFVSSPDFGATAPHVATIATLAAGMSERLTLTLMINDDFEGTSLVNNAEITDASNVYGLTDSDGDLLSVDGSSDDTSELDTDGDIDDEAPGTPGTQDNPNDEDSYDPAQVTVGQVFDLALEKMVNTTATPAPYMQGDSVEFTINVYNQGTLTATDLVVTDYLPTDMSFVSSSDFVDNTDGTATATIASLAPGAMETLSITLMIDNSFQGTTITNNAEITAATNELGYTDQDDDIAQIDGSSDDITELSTDDNIDDESVGTPGNSDNPTDEDSYDPAQVVVEQIYDLALMKVVDTTATPGPYIPGAEVIFTLTLENQGTLDAAGVEVTDYLPAGLTLNDSNRTDTGDGTATYNTLLALGAGTSKDITINFTIAGTVFTTISNRAEISDDDAQETYGVSDTDSTPDMDTTNDNQPTAPYGDPDDDMIIGDGKNGGDEDDHDLASLEPAAYDLALTKSLKDTSLVYMQGDDVTFTITLENQGYIDGEDIVITDYIPSDMSLNDTDWTDNGDGTASYMYNPVLQPGTSVDVDITLTIDPLFQGTEIANRAEISSDNGAIYGGDLDSTPDANQSNDNQPSSAGSAGDDVTSEDGTNGGDEDDHDPAKVTVGQIYDLALMKTLVGNSTVQPLDTVIFNIEVFNQGTYHADDIEIIDYIPTGMVLTDIDWTDNGNGTATYIVGSLERGDSVVVPITFQVQSEGTLTNWAEISKDDSATYGGDVDSSADSDRSNDNQPIGAGEPTDDMVGQDGTNGGDEDDHDPASVTATAPNSSGSNSAPRPEPTPIIPAEPVNIYGTIFFDDEDDDVYGDDVGLARLVVTLYDSDGKVLMTTTTDKNGDYAFENLPAGEYSVGYITNPELYPTYVSDSNIAGYVDESTGAGPDSEENGIMFIQNIILDPGEDSVENDFALIVLEEKPVNIYGTIFFDDEDDDLYGDDVGLNGLVVTLYDVDGNVIMTSTTNENGDYAFEVLSAGEYSVGYVANPELYPTYVTDSNIAGYVDEKTGVGPDSKENGIMFIQNIILDPGEDSIENDFALIETPKESVVEYIINMKEREEIVHKSAYPLDLPLVLPATGVGYE